MSSINDHTQTWRWNTEFENVHHRNVVRSATEVEFDLRSRSLMQAFHHSYAMDASDDEDREHLVVDGEVFEALERTPRHFRRDLGHVAPANAGDDTARNARDSTSN